MQTEPREQPKESNNTSTSTDDDSVIKEDTAVSVDDEPTTNDLVEESVADIPLEESTAGEVPAENLITNVSVKQSSSTSANKGNTRDKGGCSRSV